MVGIDGMLVGLALITERGRGVKGNGGVLYGVVTRDAKGATKHDSFPANQIRARYSRAHVCVARIQRRCLRRGI